MESIIERTIMKNYPFILGYKFIGEPDNDVHLIKLYYKDYKILKPVREEIIDEIFSYYISLSPNRKERLIIHFINI